MTNNPKVETMQDLWGDSIEIMTVNKSVNGDSITYITFSPSEDSEDDVVMIFDLAKLDQLITLLQKAREGLAEDAD